MTKPEIRQAIDKILLEEFQIFPDAINNESTLESLGMDSLDTIFFVSECETRFQIEEIQGDAVLTTSSLQSIIDVIYNIKN